MERLNAYEIMQPRGQLLTSFIAAMLWASTDNGDNFLDDAYCIEEIEEESANKIKKLCSDFMALDDETLLIHENNYELAGHDLFLTMAGHGAGFWDGDWPKGGDTLTERVSSLVNPDSVHVFAQDGQVFIEFSKP